jgi:cytochrome c
VKDNFEFDKIILAIAFGILAIILSNAIGGFLYRTDRLVEKRGYQIEVIAEIPGGAEAPKGLPDVIEIGKIMVAASADAGQAVFKQCMVCHTSGKGEANKVGPNLWGVVGANVARHKEFQYSSAMSKRGTDGKTWTYEDLYRYIYSPKSYIPGNKMAFAGVKKDADRANLLAYLRTLSDSPIALPPVEK